MSLINKHFAFCSLCIFCIIKAITWLSEIWREFDSTRIRMSFDECGITSYIYADLHTSLRHVLEQQTRVVEGTLIVDKGNCEPHNDYFATTTNTTHEEDDSSDEDGDDQSDEDVDDSDNTTDEDDDDSDKTTDEEDDESDDDDNGASARSSQS